jgi:SAM-dependent methyltransferase
VLDVGCGTGFFTAFYLERGASVTGLDLTAASVEGLRRNFPDARFEQADVSEIAIDAEYDLVNVFDVFFHIVDDARWETALRNVCRALRPGGLLVYSDVFMAPTGQADHNRTRVLERHRQVLASMDMEVLSLRPTHVLLNRELGGWRFLNRAPRLLYAADRVLLGLGADPGMQGNRLLVARRRLPA